jgi:hypothetical protein
VTKAFVLYAYHNGQPGGDYLGSFIGSFRTVQEAEHAARTSTLWSNRAWSFQVRAIPERYGDPVRKWWV